MSKKELVVKSNELIQASYTLSLTEQRLVLLAIVEARATGAGICATDHLTISAAAYSHQFAVSMDAAYLALRDSAATLFERQVTLYDIDPTTSKRRKRVTRWVSEVAYIDDAAKVQLIFAPAVVPEITRLEANFTSYELEQVSALKSVYAVRLYELLIQWRAVGKTPVFEISVLRGQLGVEQHEHLRMCDFKTRVLNYAVAQINQCTDLSVTYHQYKEGRTIIGVRFEFTHRKESLAHEAVSIPAAKPVTLTPFAGLERQLFLALQKKCKTLTEKEIIRLSTQNSIDPFIVMQRLQSRFKDVERFALAEI
ncbi:MAG: hypothetical protein RLY58_2115 [Pseudomonadota bacterium]|jgi:plasmid replication initiation protein